MRAPIPSINRREPEMGKMGVCSLEHLNEKKIVKIFKPFLDLIIESSQQFHLHSSTHSRRKFASGSKT